MKFIHLTQGQVAQVDDSDVLTVSKHKWHAVCSNGRWEARTKIRVLGVRKILRMHNLVSGIPIGVDHVDGNPLNNQRANLRQANRYQNGQNRKVQKHSSRFKGVSFWKSVGKWVASINVNGKKRHLGYFKDETDAAKRYDRAAELNFGVFARTNKQMGLL